MIFDNSKLIGNFAVLEAQLDGACTMLFASFTSHFLTLDTETTSCGSITRSGFYYENGFRVDVSITDHRTRLCDDMVPDLIVVTRKFAASGLIEMLYSFEVSAL